MLAHPTLDQLNTLGLYGLAKGYRPSPKIGDSSSKLVNFANLLNHFHQFSLGLEEHQPSYPDGWKIS